MIVVKDFKFNKVDRDEIIKQSDWLYEWSVSINIYGQNIKQEDIEEIWNELWKRCLWENNTLTVETAKSTIEEIISKRKTIEDNNDLKNNDILNIINKIWEEYWTLNNYKKTIRLFEIYRMLNEGWLCKI